jgi:hypothetical protein
MLKKSPCRKLFPKIDKNFDVNFSSTSFILSRFRVFLSDGSSKTLQKTFCKKIMSKTFLQKNRQNNPKPIFFSICFNHAFGRFSVRGVQNTTRKIERETDQPWYFFGLRGTNQPRRGPSVFFWGAP